MDLASEAVAPINATDAKSAVADTSAPTGKGSLPTKTSVTATDASSAAVSGGNAKGSQDPSVVGVNAAASGNSKSPPQQNAQLSKEAKAIMRGRRDLYTSFEDNDANNTESRSAGVHSHSQQTDGYRRGTGLRFTGGRRNYSPPKHSAEVETKELVIGKNSFVAFFGRENFLSNFHTATFSVNGHQYPTVEHYYEACKVNGLIGADWARMLKDVADPGSAKSQSKRMLVQVPKYKVDQWRMTEGILAMKVAMTEKFRQNRDLAHQLLSTGDKLLAQCNRTDHLWSVGFDDNYFKKWVEENDGLVFNVPLQVTPEVVGNFPKIGRGRNLQGFIIMNVRDQLRQEFSDLGDLGLAQLTISSGEPEAATNGENGVNKEGETTKEEMKSHEVKTSLDTSI